MNSSPRSRSLIGAQMVDYRITADERARFKRCRRQWDFASPHRRNLQPAVPVASALHAALRDALDVYYYPGTWDWQHEVTQPLVHKALKRSLDDADAPDLLDRGVALLDCYDAWASEVDDFAPVKINTQPPRPADARLVQRARAAIHDDDPAAQGLFSLAEALGASPYRLSRAFPRELGVSLTRYRNRVRVGRALEQLQCGASTLAHVATSLGFADQAHFSRVVREHVGHTPSVLRRQLRDSYPEK